MYYQTTTHIILTVHDVKVLCSQFGSSAAKLQLSVECEHHGAFSRVQQATHNISFLPRASQWLRAPMMPLSLKTAGRQGDERGGIAWFQEVNKSNIVPNETEANFKLAEY